MRIPWIGHIIINIMITEEIHLNEVQCNGLSRPVGGMMVKNIYFCNGTSQRWTH